jgi:hypothetical protein
VLHALHKSSPEGEILAPVCGTWLTKKNVGKEFVQTMKGVDNVGYLGMSVRIILKLIIQMCGFGVRTGII